MTFTLYTARLLLRELERSDAIELYRIYQDPIVMRFMGPPPSDLDQERANVERHRRQSYERYGYGLWATILRDTGALIGRCGLLRTQIDSRMETELSFLLDRACWGRGYATEAARAILQAAGQRFGVDRVVAVVHPDNRASLTALERLGFVYERDVPYRDFGQVRLYAREGLRGNASSAPSTAA
ncbi:MAG TPA: GNAT family N-acetyltransferase [Gemmatimonadaceae bacterium]|nr:GNAT family N-acetyltransferase [Gemmatimonadaceae bacterium]